MVADNAEGARRRWWHRGPFVRKEVRWSVGLVLAFLFVFYLAIPLLASHREDLTALGHIHPAYLILGTVLEIGALAAYTQLTHAVLPPMGRDDFACSASTCPRWLSATSRPVAPPPVPHSDTGC